MKVIDGIELLRMIKNGEVKADTEIKVWYDDGLKEYVTTLYFNGIDLKWKPNTFYARYFYNKYTKFEIIEEEKEIEELNPVNGSDLVDLQKNSSLIEQNKAVTNLIMYLNMSIVKINELVRELNKIKKEGK